MVNKDDNNIIIPTLRFCFLLFSLLISPLLSLYHSALYPSSTDQARVMAALQTHPYILCTKMCILCNYNHQKL